MNTTDELLKIVDRLEEMWLEHWGREIVRNQGKHLSADQAQQLFLNHIQSPANKHLARQQFEPFRVQIVSKQIEEVVLHTLQKALEIPAKEQS